MYARTVYDTGVSSRYSRDQVMELNATWKSSWMSCVTRRRGLQGPHAKIRVTPRVFVRREPGLPVRARSHVRLPTIIASSTTARRCGRVSIAHTSRYVTARMKVETPLFRLLLFFSSSSSSSSASSAPTSSSFFTSFIQLYVPPFTRRRHSPVRWPRFSCQTDAETRHDAHPFRELRAGNKLRR